MSVLAWQGLPKVLDNLNAEIDRIKGKTLLGLIRGAAFVRKAMDTTPPLVPIDTGNMRSSWFIVTNKGGVRAGGSPIFTAGENDNRDVNRLQADHTAAISTSISAIKGKEPAIAMGFSAYYTMWVHENVGANFTRPGSGAKFFEAAVRNSTDKIVAMVRMEARRR